MTGSLQRGKAATRLYVKARRIGRRLRRSRRARLTGAWAAILAVAFAVGAWVVTPLAMTQALAAWADAAPGRTASARRVAVNPFTLTVSLHDVALSAPAASLGAERAVLGFGIASLFGRAVALDELTLDGARLQLPGEGASLSADAEAAFDLVSASPVAIARLTVSRGRIEWLAERREPLVLDGVTVQAFGVDTVGDAPVRFEMDAQDAVGGVLRVEGEAVLGTRVADGRVVFENVDAAPIVARFFASPSIAGTSSGAADFEWRGDAGTWHLSDATLRAARAEIEWADGSALSATSLEAAGEAELGGDAALRAVNASIAARVGDEGMATFGVRAEPGETGGRDVTLELRGVPAGVFAARAKRLTGLALEGGTVDATIEYRIDADGIDGNARLGARDVAIEQTAETLDDVNVQLALALLEDPHGAAETAFEFRAPGVAGARVDETLAAAFVAQLRILAASPFDALGIAAGVDGEALSAVSFPAGGAAPSEPGTLDALAEALHVRPRIGLRVTGIANRVLDRNALAAQQIELHVTLATSGPTLVARPQPVDFASPRHRDVLDEFAGERLGDEQRETIASYFARTPDGRIVESDRTAYYRALFDALVENEAIPSNGIERLGRYRARAIADTLTARGISETRIEIAPSVVRSEVEAADEQSGDAPPAAASAAQVEVPLEVHALLPSNGGAEEPASAAPP